MLSFAKFMTSFFTNCFGGWNNHASGTIANNGRRVADRPIDDTELLNSEIRQT